MTGWTFNAGTWRTRGEIAVWRHGWVWPLALVLGLVLLAAQWLWLPQQQAALAAQHAKRTDTLHQRGLVRPAAAQTVGTQDVRQALARHTTSELEINAVLQRIVKLAQAHGVALPQSDFQSSREGHGGLQQVQITLPLRASYPQLRGYVEALLRQLPMLSVDHIAIKREAVAQGQVEVRLKVSIWVAPGQDALRAGPGTVVEGVQP